MKERGTAIAGLTLVKEVDKKRGRLCTRLRWRVIALKGKRPKRLQARGGQCFRAFQNECVVGLGDERDGCQRLPPPQCLSIAKTRLKLIVDLYWLLSCASANSMRRTIVNRRQKSKLSPIRYRQKHRGLQCHYGTCEVFPRCSVQLDVESWWRSQGSVGYA